MTAEVMKPQKSTSPSDQDPGRNLVSWVLSGGYARKAKILVDATNESRSVSLGSAIQLVASLAEAFAPDRTVCLHLDNDITYPILCLAIFASKCRWTGANTSYTTTELAHHFQSSSTKYVVTEERQLDNVEDAVRDSGTGAEIILFGDLLKKSDQCCLNRREFRCLHDLLSQRSEEDLWGIIEDIEPHSIALLASTSGTTGKPKMAARTHASLVFESKAFEDPLCSKPYEVRRLFCTPIFHAFSAPDMLINALRLGIPSYFMQRFDLDGYVANVQRFNITETFAPPAMLLRLANCAQSAPDVHSLKMIFTGGSPFTQELRAKFDLLFASSKKPIIAPVWGMTEIGWISTLKWSQQEVTNSVGRSPEGYKVKYGERFNALENGQNTYELLVRSPSVMTGYRGNAQATDEAFDGTWLKTGDVGYVDENGRIFIVDRAKDLIKVNGFQVSPTEVGDALLQSPDVKDAAVVGVGWGLDEHPVAFVARADCSPRVSAAEIKEHLLQRLVKYKVGTCEIRFLDEIPKNPTGKTDRKELRRLAEMA